MAAYALDGQRAVVELAAVVGLDLLPGGRLDPARRLDLRAGPGDQGRHRPRRRARSCSDWAAAPRPTAAPGWSRRSAPGCYDAAGHDLPPGGGALAELASVDLGPLRATLGQAKIMVATDVDNPLLGPNGAAAVFGPQKGAGPDELDRAGTRTWHDWADVVTADDRARRRQPGQVPGRPAAPAYAALAAARRRRSDPGIELVLELVGFDARLDGADLVITGEGSLDEQSLAGKAPIGVAQAAGRAGVPVVAVAGRSLLSADRLRRGRASPRRTRCPISSPTRRGASPTPLPCCARWAGGSRKNGCRDPGGADVQLATC